MAATKIIILGGGFAGVQCAKTLRKLLPKNENEIVIFNEQNHMVFSPLLAEVASAAIKTKDVGASLRQLLSGVKIRTETVLNIDLPKKFIEYESYDLSRQKMDYDHLVIALGNTSNFAIIPGMDEHAFGLKSIGDALRLQSHVIDQMEKAEVCDDPVKKKWFLTFTVVGGGFSGVEIAGELNEFVKESAEFFETIDKDMIQVNLIHSNSQILPEVSPSLRDFARIKMEKRGINFYLERKATKATSNGLWLDDTDFLSSGTIVCTIGTTPLPIVNRLPLEKQRGRIATQPDMSLNGFENAWAIGDCAAVPNAVSNSISPPVGQFAERQGKQVAQNIQKVLSGEATKPFSYKTMGHLCAIGGMSAVAEVGGMHISGFPAWFLWRTIYLMKLPSLAQKAKVGIEWGCDLIFPRSIGYVKTDLSRSCTRAFYAPGDYIFKQGSPASDFYVIEQGEVDILVQDEETGEEETVAVLGPGDFFGEQALLESRPRNASVRARDNLMLLTMGNRLFAEISKNLVPLKEALADAAKRRRNIWKSIPEVESILEKLPLSEIIEPVPGEILRPDDFIVGLLEQFCHDSLDFCCVVGKDERLIGVLTRTDLLRTIETAARLKDKDNGILRVNHIMGHEPVVISENDSTKVAVATMRERGLKNIPVVNNAEDQKLVGCVRVEKILGHIIEELTRKQKIRITTVDMRNPFAAKARKK